MKYLLIYSEYCTPALRWFATHKEAVKWVGGFKKQYKNNPDYWVDCLLKEGILHTAYPGFDGYKVYRGVK